MMQGIVKLGVICIIVFLLVMLAYKEAIAQQTWTHVFGGSNYDSANSVQQTGDGGYIVVGKTLSFGAGWTDTWILKLDSSGNVSWQKAYGGSETDEPRSIQQTSDGGYIVAGFSDSFHAGIDYDIWVLKLDSSGNVSWQKTYGGSNDDEAYSIQQTSDGGYIVAGYTVSFGAGSWDFWVLKLDSSGNVSWQKTYGGTSDDYAYSIQQTSDGGYIVAGYTGSFGGVNDFWVLKLDSSGNVSWQKTYGGSDLDYAQSIEQTSDGGYIVAGYTWSFGAGSWDFLVLKLDSSGNVGWQKTYGGSSDDYAYSIQQTSDGGYIVAGYTDSFGAGSYDFWVLKLDSSGNVSWQKTYGGSNDDEAYSIQQTSDGGYIVTGYTYSFGAGNNDFWILKLNATGTSCSIRGNTSITPASTSITPANSTATITTTSVAASDSTATVQSTTVSLVDLCTCQGTFGDVTSANPFCVYIEKLFNKGITGGCSASPLLYCPTDFTQRQAMAKFMCLAMNSLSAGSCTTAACAGTFGDVPASNPFCTYIEGLYTAGITGGCTASPLNYCPTSFTQRQAMAKFICLGMNAANPGSCPTVACAGTFSDVPTSNPFCTYIEGMYTAGVTGGCTASPLNYCPTANTNRQAMAKFIVIGFDI